MPRGGARPGAGRPKNQPTLSDSLALKTNDALQFLRGVMADDGIDIRLRIDAAKAIVSAELRKAEAKGSKQAKDDEAKQASKGKFSPNKPPLAVVK